MVQAFKNIFLLDTYRSGTKSYGTINNGNDLEFSDKRTGDGRRFEAGDNLARLGLQLVPSLGKILFSKGFD